MIILGLTAPLSWNPGAAIVKNGKFIASAEEERFVKVKHAPRMLPLKSIEFCLSSAKAKPENVDAIGLGYLTPIEFYIKSLIENIKEFDFVRAAREAGPFAEYLTGTIKLMEWLNSRGFRITGDNKIKIKFYPHHLAHAASAFRCSGFNNANVITIDGQGEDDAGSIWIGESYKLKKIYRIGHHQSLGTVYDQTTKLLGFTPHSHEGKVMGLAAYGSKKLHDNDLWTSDNNSYFLKQGWVQKFVKKFGPQRQSSEELNDKHKNIAYTAQKFVEKAGIALARKAYEINKSENICLAGGVALNCDMNAKIKDLPFVKNIFIQPASHDAGTAIGAALELSDELGENADFAMNHAGWGPEYSNEEIEKILKESKISYKKIQDIEKFIAHELSKGKIVGWFQEKSEIGPRALGNRSILAHPGLKGMKDKINKEVKHREPWRPFAPSILHEYGHELFENYSYHPFMLLTFKATKEGQNKLSQALHVDQTGRLQSVTKENNLKYYNLINEFYKLTNIPGLLNTSFNDAEEPLVNSPKDALKTFFATGIDILVMGDYIIKK